MPTPIFINEFHLNGTASSVRGVEIAGPPSTGLSGWLVYFYNSATGALLGQTATGALNAAGFGWVNHYGVSYSATGNIGLALVNASGEVVEFITAVPDASYVTPTTGPALGMRPTNTGTGVESSSSAGSIRRTGTGTYAEDFTWTRATSGFTQYAVNTGQTFIPLDTVAPAAVSQLAATAQNDGTSVLVAWAGLPTDADFTGLRLYRDGVKVADLAKTATSYTDTDLTPSTSYDYRLASRDAAGNEGSKSVTVVTKALPTPPPVAAFTYVVSPTDRRSVAFSDTSTGSPTGWVWRFGDGGSTTTQSPTHGFLGTGLTYDVTLTATNAGGSSEVTHTVTLTAPAPDPDPDPEPEPEPTPDPTPEPTPITGLPADVIAFMGRTGDTGAEALAAEHVPVMAELVNAYVRGHGPKRTGLGLGEFSFPPDLRAVVITASARLINNPAQLDSESADGYSSRGGFSSFSLAEQAILHRYRRRSA